MLSLMLVLAGNAHASLPLSSGEWLPLLHDGTALSDPSDLADAVGHLDVVGTAADPAGHWFIDASNVYIRMRMHEDPAALFPVAYSCGFLACQWGVLMDLDGDLETFERALVLSDAAAVLQVRSGVSGSDWSADTDTVEFDALDPIAEAHVQSTPADSTIGGSADWYLEFSVPRVWLGLSLSDATIRVALATGIGISGDGFTADLATSDGSHTLTDAWSTPIGLDGDGDGLLLMEELLLGSDPQDDDTDDDGLTDLEERDLGTDPADSDTDDDELTDFEEWSSYGTDPLERDTDGDGIDDGTEVLVYGTDPNDPADPDPTIDADCDGLSDEVDPLIDGAVDSDGDGLINELEWECGTNPCIAEIDADEDGILNPEELEFGTDPCDSSDPDITLDADCDGIADFRDDIIEMANDDVDEDGVANDAELECGTNPCEAEADHDGDGLLTADEVERFGTDPCDAAEPDQTIDDDCDGTPDFADDVVEFDPLADNDDDALRNDLELSDCQTNPCDPNPDADGDGVANETEIACGTNPCAPDTDADGIWDGVEMVNGECTDADGDGIVDAVDAATETAADPTRPDSRVHGMSGGSFTGGACATAATSTTGGSSRRWLLIGVLIMTAVRRTPRGAWIVLLCPLTATHAHGASIDADQFRPVLPSHGLQSIADPVNRNTQPSGAIWLYQTSKPLQYRYPEVGRPPINLVGTLSTVRPQVGAHHGAWFGNASVPFHVRVKGTGEAAWANFGDATLSAGRVVRDRTAHAIGIAVMGQATLPTGNQELWLARTAARGGASIHMATGHTVLTGATLGIEAGSPEDLPGFELGPVLNWALAATTPIQSTHALGGEIRAHHTLTELSLKEAHAIELSALWRWQIQPNLSVQTGFGTGLTGGIGAPRLRLFSGVTVAPALPRFATKKAVKPTVAEAPDPSPATPLAATIAVLLTVIDENGQPVVAEVHSDQTSKQPLAVSNGDGIAVFNLDAIDREFWVRASGFSPSRYTIVQREAPEIQVSMQLARKRVRIDETQIRIDDKIYFETGLATIWYQSLPLLDEVALVLLDNPSLTKVEVRGHTDEIGQPADNLTLSQMRAEAVMNYLIQVGVDPSRLTARGFGESQPLKAGTSEVTRASNRRVEFVIIASP